MGNCVKKSLLKGDSTITRSKSLKPKESIVKNSALDISFVEIAHKEGDNSQYFYSPPPAITASSSEIINITAETIDQKRATVQMVASEKVLNLKEKVCEALSLAEVILIFDGKVLDSNETVGNSVPQGGNLDIIAL